MGTLVGRHAEARGAGRARWSVGARRAAARRADQPSRLHVDHVARRPAARLQGQRAVHHPRPQLPRQRRHPHHRTRPRPAAVLSRQFHAPTRRARREQLEIEEVENAKFDKFLAQEEVWIRKGVKARRMRDEGRVRRLEALRLHARRAPRPAGPGQARRVRWRTFRQDRGRTRERIARAMASKVIVSDFSATILRGDKVGLIGANGAGKTTLLKLILGEETARQRHGRASAPSCRSPISTRCAPSSTKKPA